MAARKASTIIHEGQDKPAASKERHYVDNKAFYDALVERRAAISNLAEGELPPKVTEFIGECIFKIADNLSKKYNFAGLPFREDMVGAAAIHCLKNIDSFDPSVTKNPFSYYTQTCYYEFLGVIAAERNQTYVTFKSITESSALHELAQLDDVSGGSGAQDALLAMDHTQDYMNDFIKQYEEKRPVKGKRKARKVKDPILGDMFGNDEDDGE